MSANLPGQTTIEILSRPTDVDLLNFIDASRSQKGQPLNYVWSSTKNEPFILTLRNNGLDVLWELAKQEDPDKKIWTFFTNDVSEVYTKIIKSTGEDFESAIKNDLKATRGRIKILPEISQELDSAMEHTFEGNKKVISNELEKLKAEQESALSGELSMMHITNVLQSIALAKISGRLSIDAKEKQVDIFFEGGTPVHAIGTMGDGRECMLRTLSLQEGRFHFDLAMRTEQRTITESLEAIILSGVKLADNTRFLTELGLVNESILVRRNRNLSEQEFESIFASQKADINALKSFYLVIDSTSSLRELVRRVGFQRSKWVKIVSELIRNNVIAIREDSQDHVAHRKEFDPKIIQSFKSTITNPASQILTYPAFLFLLQYEANRIDEEHHLSLLMFDLNTSSNSTMPAPVLDGIVWLINEIKRPIDIVGHYENDKIAVMLPNMKSRAATVLAERIAERVSSDPRTKSVEMRDVSTSFGVASVPGDVDDVFKLLTAAELALQEARKRKAPVVAAQDLSS